MAINDKINRSPATGAPWELTAEDWNTLWEQVQMVRQESYGPIGDNSTVLARGGITARTLAAWLADSVNVASFGALPDDEAGAVDSSVAFQAAFDEAAARANATEDGWPGGCEVVIPPGTYYWDSPVVLAAEAASAVPPLKSNRMSVNLRGLGGAWGVNIVYRGTGTALTIKNNTHFAMSGVHVRNSGTGDIGIAFQSNVVGSATGQCSVSSVDVSGFPVGIQIGDASDHAASEIFFDCVGLNSNDMGIKVVGTNSLNIWIQRLTGVNLGPAVVVDRDPVETNINLAVRDSSAGFDGSTTGPVYWFKTFGVYLLDNVAFEWGGSGYMVQTGPDTPVGANASQEIIPTTLTMTNCRSVVYGGDRNVFNMGGTYTIKGCADYGCQLGGRAVGDKGAIEVSGCVTSQAGGIFSYKTSCGVTWKCLAYNNALAANNNQSTHADEHFLYLSDGTKRVLQSFAWNDAYNEVDEELPYFPKALGVGAPIEDPVALAVAPANGATYSPNLTEARSWEFTAGSGVASFTIGAITPQVIGSRLRIRLKNTSGSPLAVSWHWIYKIPTWTNLATGKSRTYEFENSPINVCTCISVGPDVDN